MTDGMVAGRTISDRQLIDTFIEGETLVYPIYFQDPKSLLPMPDVRDLTPEQLEQPPFRYLNALSSVSGGMHFANATDFQTAFQSIANELKVQYVLDFYPETDENGKMYPNVSLEVNRENSIIRTKRSLRLKKLGEQKNLLK